MVALPPDYGLTYQLRNWILYKLVRLIQSNRARRRFILLGEHVRYVNWMYATFGTRTPIFRTREKLFELVLQNIRVDGRSYSVLEFGVANGYTTNYFLSRTTESEVTRWCGFDTFTGLPRSWRDLSAGTFSSNGSVPQLDDARLCWFVGRVEKTFREGLVPKTPKLLIFDLDLYEPTLYCYQLASTSLSNGDILYFDEAFDRDEFAVIEHYLLREYEVECIGFTHVACALRIIKQIQNRD